MSGILDFHIQCFLYSRTEVLTRRDSEGDDDEAGRIGKSAVIGIAVAATIIVLIAIMGLAYWLIRRRCKRRNKTIRNGDSHESAWNESNGVHPEDRSSKTPLIQHGEETSMTTLQPSESRHDEASVPLAIPRRTHSDASVHSLPPSYACATRSTIDEPDSLPPGSGRHRPESIPTSSNGLRPLSLVEAYRHDDHDHSARTSPERQSRRNRLSLGVPNRERSRSASRFHEDLDD